MLLQCLVMPLQWVKLADHCNSSMGSSQIGYLCLYFSEKKSLLHDIHSIVYDRRMFYGVCKGLYWQ